MPDDAQVLHVRTCASACGSFYFFIVDGWGSYELRVEDDPRVSPADRERSRAEGTFGTVRPVLTDGKGVQHVVRDLRSRY